MSQIPSGHLGHWLLDLAASECLIGFRKRFNMDHPPLLAKSVKFPSHPCCQIHRKNTANHSFVIGLKPRSIDSRSRVRIGALLGMTICLETTTSTKQKHTCVLYNPN